MVSYFIATRVTPHYKGASPAQLLLGIPILDLLPANRGTLNPTWQKSMDELEKKAVLANEPAEEPAGPAPSEAGDHVILPEPIHLKEVGGMLVITL